MGVDLPDLLGEVLEAARGELDGSPAVCPRRVAVLLRCLGGWYVKGTDRDRRNVEDALRGESRCMCCLLVRMRDAAKMMGVTGNADWIQQGLIAARLRGEEPQREIYWGALARLQATGASVGVDAAGASRTMGLPDLSGAAVDHLDHDKARDQVAGGPPTLAETLTASEWNDIAERRSRDRILRFVGQHQHPFDRRLADGHLTGSGVIVSRDGGSVVLVRHRKLGIWLQPGGHARPEETRGEDVAMRESREETGLSDLVMHPLAPRPFDLDVHAIPARGDEAAHEHLDLRYLALASRDEALRGPAEEVAAVRWFSWGEAEALGLDGGLRRALRKAREWMA